MRTKLQLFFILLICITAIPTFADKKASCRASEGFNAESELGISYFLQFSNLRSFHCEDMCTTLCVKQKGYEFGETHMGSEWGYRCGCQCFDYSGCIGGATPSYTPPNATLPLVKTTTELTIDGGLTCRADVIPPAKGGAPFSDTALIDTVGMTVSSESMPEVTRDFTLTSPASFNKDGSISYELKLPPSVADNVESPSCKATLYSKDPKRMGVFGTNASSCQCPKKFISMLEGYRKMSVFPLIESADRTVNVCDGCGRPLFEGMKSIDLEKHLQVDLLHQFPYSDFEGARTLADAVYNGYAPIAACLQNTKTLMNGDYWSFEDAQVKAGVAEYYYTLIQLSYAQQVWSKELTGIETRLAALNGADDPYTDMVVNDINTARGLYYYQQLYNTAAFDAGRPGTWTSRALDQFSRQGTIPSGGDALFSIAFFRTACQIGFVGAAPMSCSKQKIIELIYSMRDLYASFVAQTLAPHLWLEQDKAYPDEVPVLVAIGQNDPTREVVLSRMRKVLLPSLMSRKAKLQSLLGKLPLVKSYLACPTAQEEKKIGDIAAFIRELPEVAINRPTLGGRQTSSSLQKKRLEVAYLWGLVSERRDAQREAIDVADDALASFTIGIAELLFFSPATIEKLGMVTLSYAARARALLTARSISGAAWSAEKAALTGQLLKRIRSAEATGSALEYINIALMPRVLGGTLTGIGAVTYAMCEKFSNIPTQYLACRSAATTAIATGLFIFAAPGKIRPIPQPIALPAAGEAGMNFFDPLVNIVRKEMDTIPEAAKAVETSFWENFTRARPASAGKSWKTAEDVLRERPPPFDLKEVDRYGNLIWRSVRNPSTDGLKQNFAWTTTLELSMFPNQAARKYDVTIYFHTYAHEANPANWGIVAQVRGGPGLYRGLLAECKVAQSGENLERAIEKGIAYDDSILGIVENDGGTMRGLRSKFLDVDYGVVQWKNSIEYKASTTDAIQWRRWNRNPSNGDLEKISIWDRAHWTHSADLMR